MAVVQEAVKDGRGDHGIADTFMLPPFWIASYAVLFYRALS